MSPALPSSQKCMRLQIRNMVLPVEPPNPQAPAPTVTDCPGVHRPTPALCQPQFRLSPTVLAAHGWALGTSVLVRHTLGHRSTTGARGMASTPSRSPRIEIGTLTPKALLRESRQPETRCRHCGDGAL